MRSPVRPIAVELTWLLGWYGLAVLLLGSLVGFHRLLAGKPLDIQMHNTYFVVAWWHLTILLFLLVAALGTSVRAVRGQFSRRATQLVLVVSGMVWLPPLVGALLLWLMAGKGY